MENEKIDKTVKETVDAIFKPKSLVDKLYQIYSHSCYTNIDYSFTKNDEIYYKDIRQALTEYEKQKQILEVLKDKEVDIAYLKYCIHYCKKEKEKINRAFVYYNETRPTHLKITETEFNLIKEWLI